MVKLSFVVIGQELEEMEPFDKYLPKNAHRQDMDISKKGSVT